MDLLASYDDGDNSGTNSPFTKKDEQKPVSPTASLQAEWESFEKMIGGGNDESSEKEERVSADQYLVDGIVAYPGMGQTTTEHKDSSVDGANLSPERKKGRSLADDVMKLLSSSNLSEELDMPPRRRSHSSDSSRSSSSDRSESKSPSESPERETEAKDGTPERTEERLRDTDHKESRQRTTSNASATSVDERSSAQLEKSSRSPKRRRSRSRSPARRKRSRSSRSRNRSGSRSRKRSRERKKSPSHRSRDRRHKKDRRSSRDRRKRRGKESKRRSRSRDRHHKRSHKRSRSRSPRHKRRRSRSRSRSREKTHRSRSRSRDRSHRSRSRSRERQHRVDHGRPGSSREDGEKHLTFKEKMRQQLLKASKYLQGGESIEGIDGKSLDVPKEKPSKLPLNDKSFFAAMAASTASGVTPQMALIQTMAAMHQKAQEMTGVAVPKYYNPAAVNPLKYAEQVQKRKLLWSKNKDKKDDKEKEWEHTSFVSDQSGKVAAKFRKLMGIKHEGQEEEDSTTEVSEEQKKKHDELFSRLDKEYEFARMATHTHRGVGLGFSSQGYPTT